MTPTPFGPGFPDTTTEYLRTKVGDDGYRNPPIRSTAIDTLATCPRMFLLNERMGIKSRGYAGSRTRGSLYHELMSNLRLHGDWQKAVTAATVEVSKGEEELRGSAGPDGLLPGGVDLSTSIKSLHEDFKVAQAMARAFWDVYPLDSTRWALLTDGDGNQVVERLYQVQLPMHVRPVVVRFDCVLLDQEDMSSIWIMDDKTTSIAPIQRAAYASFSTQTFLYRLVLEELLKQWGREGQVVGFIHNIIRTPTIRQTQRESFVQYVERVSRWYREKAEAGETPILQSWTRYSQDPLGDLEFDMVLGNLDIASSGHPFISNFPRNSGACFKFNRLCPYMDLCTSDPANWPQIIDRKYDIRFREDEEQETENGD